FMKWSSVMIATNAQQSTAEVLAPGGGSALLRVERAWFSGGWVLISGWTTAGARLQAVADSTELISLQYERRYRADVSKAVNDSSGSPFGFALLCQSSFPDQLGLKW